jgi:hypothetical protein
MSIKKAAEEQIDKLQDAVVKSKEIEQKIVPLKEKVS